MNKTIIQLPPASTVYGDDVIPIMQLGVVTRHISASQLGITPVATILAMTSASSANAVAVAANYTDAQVAAIDLSSYATKSLASDMSGASLQAAKAYTDAASGSLITYINSLPTGDATLRADVMAVSAGLDSRIDALEAIPIPDIFRAEVAAVSAGLVAYTNTVSGNLSTAISNKVGTWELAPYCLKTTAASMSANALVQANAFTETASGSLVAYINSLPSGGGNTNCLPLSGGLMTGGIDISGSNARIRLFSDTLGLAGILRGVGEEITLMSPSGINRVIINDTYGNLFGSWFLNSAQIADITDVWTAQSNAEAYTRTASGNIMSYVTALPIGATMAQVASASGNALTQANAFTTTASGNLAASIALKANTTLAASMSANALRQANTITYAASANALVQANTITYAASANALSQANAFSVSTSANALVQANVLTVTASGNIMAYVGTIGSVTPAYVQSASANAFVQSNAFTTTASGNIMTYVGQITANPPGNYVNLTTAQSVSGIKTFVNGVESTASNNQSFGREAGLNLPYSVANNTLIGYRAGKALNTGDGGNTIVGSQALELSPSARYNTILGYQAGQYAGGTGNVYLGYVAGNSMSGNYQLVIDSTSGGTSSTVYMWGDQVAGTLFIKGDRVATYTSAISGLNMLDKPVVNAPRERVLDLGAISGAQNIDMSLANVFTLTLTGPMTATFTNPPANQLMQSTSVFISQIGTNNNITWTNTRWAGGTASTLTSGGLDHFIFATYNGGGFYIGSAAMKDIR